MTYYVPVTPGDTPMIYGIKVRVLASKSEIEAWTNLEKESGRTKQELKRRGYTMEQWENWKL